MSFLGTLHQTAFYGLISAIVSLIGGKVSIQTLIYHATHVSNFTEFFICFMFWCSVLFIPIGIICAFQTKYADFGFGITFMSTNPLIIFFAHIGEEIWGLVATPFWLLKAIFTRDWEFWAIVDFIVYFLELIFIFFGMKALFGF